MKSGKIDFGEAIKIEGYQPCPDISKLNDLIALYNAMRDHYEDWSALDNFKVAMALNGIFEYGMIHGIRHERARKKAA